MLNSYLLKNIKRREKPRKGNKRRLNKSHETRGDMGFDKPYEKLNDSMRGLKSSPLINFL